MSLAALPTPAALIDLDILEANARSMRSRCERLGVRLRPHVKTHKCLEARAIQGGVGVTVSTLAEARAFGGDVTWALPLPIGREEEARALGVAVLVDHLETARVARNMKVWMKVDCGYGRAGVRPEDPLAVDLARWLVDHTDFQGLLTHGGHSYDCRGVEELRAVARQERDAVRDLARDLRALGIPVPQLSIGSTPTLAVAEEIGLEGIDEVRPGNYLFHDLAQVGIGSCTREQVAVTVLTTVIGAYADRVVVDAGALALSKDPGSGVGGYGEVLGHPEWCLRSLSQEHGVIPMEHPLPVGTRLRILPQHSCLIGPLHPHFTVMRGDEVVDRWQPIRGW